MSDFAFFNSTFNLTTLTSVGNQSALSLGIGGLTGIGIFSFLFFLLPIHHHEIQIAFKLGIQGEEFHVNEELPWRHSLGVRAYDNMGRFIKGTMTGYVCTSGRENCVVHIHPVKRQPAYAMIQGAPKPACLAAVGIRYESGDKYGWVGNWAQTCEQPCYCRDNNTALAFHRHKHPGFFDGTSLPERVWTRPNEKEPPEKRAEGQADEAEGQADEAEEEADEAEGEADEAEGKADEAEGEADEAEGQADEESARHMAPEISPGMWKRSVKSYMSHHSAKFLCESGSSAGPSLVAMSDRLFCHMPNKVLYHFCADVESGGCWDHEAHRFDAKGSGKIHARAALPNIVFDKPLVWGAPDGSS
ncbi:hypothetical protein E4U31_003918 [Claviceps sp. LM219 group G6]|nr:hypothetical protein E4U31_003918 [Claviceps sp. LM219 group G6]